MAEENIQDTQDNVSESIQKEADELQECKKKRDEYLNNWKRSAADFINYKKEEMERIGFLAKYAKEDVILKILPILDNVYFAEKQLPENLKIGKEGKSSIVAIGFNPTADRITILGSGFISGGKIITCAHLLNNLSEEQIKSLKANVMVEQVGSDMERYQWMPIKLFKKDIKNDLAVFEFEQAPENIKNVSLRDSEDVEVGQDVYFIGFPYAAQLMNDGFGVTLVVNKGMIRNIKRDGTDPEKKRNWFIIDAI